MNAPQSDALTRLLKGQLSIGAALGFDAESIASLVEVGRGHLRAGRPQDAVRIFRGLCALEPEVSALWELQALGLERAGDLGGSEEAFTKALHLAEPATRPEIYAARGLLRVRLGDAPGALADLTLARPDVDATLAAEIDRWMASLPGTLPEGGASWA